MRHHKLILSLILILFCSSCSSTIDSVEEYHAYINNETNGLKKTVTKGDIQISLKYLPTDYLIYNELSEQTKKQQTKSSKDSLREIYSPNLHFLMSIKEKAKNPQDIVVKNTQGYSDYAVNMHLMNFQMQKFIELLYADGKHYQPSIAVMENTYGLKKSRDINIVFSPDKKAEEFKRVEKLKIRYIDILFESGIYEFTFKTEDIKNIPKLIIDKK